MIPYEQCLERAQQLQLRAIKEKKACTIAVNVHASDGFFAINVLSEDGKIYADSQISDNENPRSDYNEGSLSRVERAYESIQ
jgi:hypothetical protein